MTQIAKVYVVERCFPYEGATLIGVAATFDAAHIIAGRDLNGDDYMGEWRDMSSKRGRTQWWENQPRVPEEGGGSYATYHSYMIEEMEVEQ